MTHEQFNIGFIFNQLPNLLSKGINGFSSESDFFVKLARVVKQDTSITHDQSIFRKIRSSEDSEQIMVELIELLGFDEKRLNVNSIENLDLKAVGGWFVVESIVNGYRASGLGDNERGQTYLDFVLAHCQLEKSCIAQCLIEKDINNVSDYIEKWLLTKIDFADPSKEEKALYVCNLTMYLAALIECGMELLLETDINSLLSKVLPRYEKKNQDHLLIPSSEVLLEKSKAAWANEKYGKSKLSWNQFYRDILIAQASDESLRKKHKKYAEIDTINPDTNAIKKRFQRWRAGELFTLEDLRTDLAILRMPYKESCTQLGLEFYFLVNIFTHVQSDLIKSGLHPSKVCEFFSQYDNYKNLVYKRFNTFENTRTLTP